MLRNPRYVIAVRDLEHSARYYRDVLGFEVREVGDPAGECPDALPAEQLGDHSYFAYVLADDIDELYAEVTATVPFDPSRRLPPASRRTARRATGWRP